MPHLIINADDYGRTPGISRGIRHAHLHGIVTSATVMMNMPTASADVRRALEHTPTLGLGVHLVLTAGCPLSSPAAVPSLVSPSGLFHTRRDFIQRAPRLNPEEAKTEWRAQIEAFIAVAGKPPTHLDSHHHASYFTPALLRAMLELAREYGLPVRLPVSREAPARLRGIPDALAPEMCRAAPDLLAEFQPRRPDAFFDSFYAQGATVDGLLAILNTLPERGCYEIMCHPGFVDDALLQSSSYTHQREHELSVLTSPEVRQAIARRGIQLVSFSTL